MSKASDVLYMLKVTVLKQLLKFLQTISRYGQKSNWRQIIERLTLISQSISLSLNHSQIHSIPASVTTVTSHCYNDFIPIQKPKKNTTQNSNKATTRSQLNSPPPSRSGVLPSLCKFWKKRKARKGNCYSK